ncbi:MAG: alpha/beta hydrolase, partial [Chitinophagaceae bacterium]
MPYITNNKQGKEVKIFYQDHGEGQPVVLIHGWPLSHSSWEMQMPVIV